MKVYTKVLCTLLLATGCIYGAANSDINQELMKAAKDGNTEKVQDCLNKDANVNAGDKYGHTPLHFAAGKGNIDIVKLLLEHGADVSSQGMHGDTPLYSAVREGNIDIVKLLLERDDADANLQGTFGDTPLCCAIWKGNNIDIVKLLLEHGADVNLKNWFHAVPLCCAIGKGNVAMVKLLLLAGADKSLIDAKKKTACTASIDNFPNNVAVVSLKQTIINAVNKDQNNKIPSNYPSLLLQSKDWDSYKANFDNYQAMLVKNDSKKDDKK